MIFTVEASNGVITRMALFSALGFEAGLANGFGSGSCFGSGSNSVSGSGPGSAPALAHVSGSGYAFGFVNGSGSGSSSGSGSGSGYGNGSGSVPGSGLNCIRAVCHANVCTARHCPGISLSDLPHIMRPPLCTPCASPHTNPVRVTLHPPVRHLDKICTGQETLHLSAATTTFGTQTAAPPSHQFPAAASVPTTPTLLRQNPPFSQCHPYTTVENWIINGIASEATNTLKPMEETTIENRTIDGFTYEATQIHQASLKHYRRKLDD